MRFLGIPLFSGFPIDIFKWCSKCIFTVLCTDSQTAVQTADVGIYQLCYGVGFLFSILVFLNIVPSLQKIFHIQLDKNMTVYTLIFSIVFLVIYTFFTFLWRLLIRSVFIREENHQAEKIREFNSAISKTLDLQEILDRTIRVMKELMDVGNIYICMQNVPGEPYRGVASGSAVK